MRAYDKSRQVNPFKLNNESIKWELMFSWNRHDPHGKEIDLKVGLWRMAEAMP
jgi:hypothetical protein